MALAVLTTDAARRNLNFIRVDPFSLLMRDCNARGEPPLGGTRFRKAMEI